MKILNIIFSYYSQITVHRTNEIVLPQEQTGEVHDNWMWKDLVRRGATKEGRWLSAPHE